MGGIGELLWVMSEIHCNHFCGSLRMGSNTSADGDIIGISCICCGALRKAVNVVLGWLCCWGSGLHGRSCSVFLEVMHSI
jgi:hypothetical protein